MNDFKQQETNIINENETLNHQPHSNPPLIKTKKTPVILLSIITAVLLIVTIVLTSILVFNKIDAINYGDLFSETQNGLVKAKTGDKWGYIDKTGKYVINPQFDEAENFYNGLAIVAIDDKIGFIDTSGKYVINPQFDDASEFNEGIACVKSNGKYGYIDKSGKYIINPQFDSAYSFADGIALVEADDKYGYINTKGKYIINPQFDDANTFSNGLAAVKSGEQWGYINQKGDLIINYQYAEAYSMSTDGYAIVMTLNKSLIIIDKKSNQVTAGEFDAIDYEDNENICIEDGCYNYAIDDYCSTHDDSSSDYSYCDAIGCYEKAYAGDYCITHNYLE